MIRTLVLALSLFLAAGSPSWASGSRSSSRSSGRTSSRSTATRARSSKKCSSCIRDSRGRIQRSAAARSSFKKSNPCPTTGKSYGACKGYVIDHITPLKRGGVDAPGNMQWQTKTAAAKAKDTIE